MRIRTETFRVCKALKVSFLRATLSDEPRQGIHALVEHLFRHEAGRMLVALTRLFGLAILVLAREVVRGVPNHFDFRAQKSVEVYGCPEIG